MNAFQLCQRHVVTVRRHESVATAAWMMRERNVGSVVVVEPCGGTAGGERPIGMLTDRDIVTTVIVRETDPRDVAVEDVMTRQPVTVACTAGIDEILLRMRNGAVRRAPVVDERGRLVGIVALDDIFEHLSTRPLTPVTSIRREPRREREPEHAS